MKLDEVKEVHRQLGELLDDPHPGLWTWQDAVQRRILRFGELAKA